MLQTGSAVWTLMLQFHGRRAARYRELELVRRLLGRALTYSSGGSRISRGNTISSASCCWYPASISDATCAAAFLLASCAALFSVPSSLISRHISGNHFCQ
jgi:hypothetical protein